MHHSNSDAELTEDEILAARILHHFMRAAFFNTHETTQVIIYYVSLKELKISVAQQFCSNFICCRLSEYMFWSFNPISVSLIFDNFLGWGGGIGCPPSKIGPNWARKVLKTVLESSQKIMGGITHTKNVKKCHLLG